MPAPAYTCLHLFTSVSYCCSIQAKNPPKADQPLPGVAQIDSAEEVDSLTQVRPVPLLLLLLMFQSISMALLPLSSSCGAAAC